MGSEPGSGQEVPYSGNISTCFVVCTSLSWLCQGCMWCPWNIFVCMLLLWSIHTHSGGLIKKDCVWALISRELCAVSWLTDIFKKIIVIIKNLPLLVIYVTRVLMQKGPLTKSCPNLDHFTSKTWVDLTHCHSILDDPKASRQRIAETVHISMWQQTSVCISLYFKDIKGYLRIFHSFGEPSPIFENILHLEKKKKFKPR